MSSYDAFGVQRPDLVVKAFGGLSGIEDAARGFRVGAFKRPDLLPAAESTKNFDTGMRAGARARNVGLRPARWVNNNKLAAGAIGGAGLLGAGTLVAGSRNQ